MSSVILELRLSKHFKKLGQASQGHINEPVRVQMKSSLCSEPAAAAAAACSFITDDG